MKGAKTARSLLNGSEDSTSHSAKGLQGSRESRFLGSREGRPDKNMTVLEEGQTKCDPYQCPFAPSQPTHLTGTHVVLYRISWVWGRQWLGSPTFSMQKLWHRTNRILRRSKGPFQGIPQDRTMTWALHVGRSTPPSSVSTTLGRSR